MQLKTEGRLDSCTNTEVIPDSGQVGFEIPDRRGSLLRGWSI